MNYTDESAVENYLLTDINDTFSDNITRWIGAMSRWMDRQANRTLVNHESTTRQFDGDGSNELLIDEVCSISAATLDDVDIMGETLFQYPANRLAKYRLEIEGGYFPKGRQNVEITGVFALHQATNATDLDSVPEDIQWACTVLVAGIVNNANGQRDGVKSEKVGQYSVTYNDPKQRKDYVNAMHIIRGYRRIAV